MRCFGQDHFWLQLSVTKSSLRASNSALLSHDDHTCPLSAPISKMVRSAKTHSHVDASQTLSKQTPSQLRLHPSVAQFASPQKGASKHSQPAETHLMATHWRHQIGAYTPEIRTGAASCANHWKPGSHRDTPTKSCRSIDRVDQSSQDVDLPPCAHSAK